MVVSLNQVIVEGQVVIVGAMSHMCIDATTRAAHELGLKCTVIHDACATRDLESRAGRSRPKKCMPRSWPRSAGGTPK